jgi:hypothetical protein
MYDNMSSDKNRLIRIKSIRMYTARIMPNF